jgi:two-component system response regulator HydG
MNGPTYPPEPILIVDDDQDLQRSFAAALRKDGIDNLVQVTDSRRVEPLIQEQPFSGVILDLNMPNISGRDLLPMIATQQPETPVVVVTGVDDVHTAVQCMRGGAFDYMVKPLDADALSAAVRRVIDVHDIRLENTRLKERILAPELAHPEAFRSIMTNNKTMFAVFRYIEAVASSNQPILVTGETGVGKELIARAVHAASGRKGDFVPVNIAGLDDNMFSDTLFGHTKGAFTGATEARKGLIERASGGTLFLDEIGDLNMASQVKLLRLVQEREYHPVGSDVPRMTDAGIVVATNRDLRQLKQSERFRDDLYYRLHAHHVEIPPLRDRLDDLPLLVEHFLAKASDSIGKRKPTPPNQLFTLLTTYRFPGNVRELETMCFNAVSLHASGILAMDTFKSAISEHPEACAGPSGAQEESAFLSPSQPLPTVREAERLLIREALRRTDGNQTMAAELLGITRQTLIRHVKQDRG